MEDVKHSSSKKRFSVRGNKKRSGLLLLVALLLIAIATAAFFVNRYNESQKEVVRLSNPTEAAKDEQQKLISDVGLLLVLPSGETPAIATVTDVSKIQDQPFFKDAQNGDKVLIYTKAKKAILYRPSTNKIINVAPVNLGKSSSSTGTTTPPPATKTP